VQADQGLDRLRRVRVRESETRWRTPSCRTRKVSSCSPTTTRFQAAASFADWKNAPGFLPDPDQSAGKDELADHERELHLMHAKQDKPQNAAEVVKFFDWAFHNGQKMAAELDYVPMPDAVTKLIADAWKTQLKDSSGKPIL
jgi:phosphate transport system substrate-binding protein